MKIDKLMKQAIKEQRKMIIHDGYNNLYRLEPHNEDCYMYEHYATLRSEVEVSLTYEMIENENYEELI